MLAKHALSQLSYGPEMAVANRQWAVGSRQNHYSLQAATVFRLPTAYSRLPNLVGLGRLELPTSRLSSARSNQLSYKPEPQHATRALSRAGSSVKKEKRRRRKSRMIGLTGRIFQVIR